MAVGVGKLADGVQQASKLRELPPHRREEAEADAFGALRAGIMASKSNAEALDCFQDQDMVDALQVLTSIGTHKKVQRGRAIECLKILLGRPRWFVAAQCSEPLSEPLQRLLGDSLDLSGPPPTSTPPKASARGPLDLTGTSLRADAAEIVKLIDRSATAMRRYSFEFPQEKIDEDATEAFMLTYEGVKRLSASSRMRACAGAVAEALENSQLEWSGIIRFLLGIHGHPNRRAYRARVAYVVERLAELSAPFASALAAEAAEREGGRLPWGRSSSRSTEASDGLEEWEDADSGDEQHRSPSMVSEAGAAAEEALPEPPGMQQHGRYAIHNGFNREIVVYVEQTQQELRLHRGQTAVIEVGLERVDVRVNHVGFFGLTSRRTRLGCESLNHMCYYSIVPDGTGCRSRMLAGA